MSIISQFYGIIIRIYFNDTEKHYLKHIHVQYNEYDAVFSIRDIELLEWPNGEDIDPNKLYQNSTLINN